MALPDLATLADIEARLETTLTVTQQANATARLHDASAAVRLYTGQQFTQPLADGETGVPVADTVRLRVSRGKVRLPQRPVTAVDAVTFTSYSGTQSPVYWAWDGIDKVFTNANVLNTFAFEPMRFQINVVAVTYWHGYPLDNLPPVLVGLVAQIVGRAIGVPLIQTGITQEAIAGYSYSTGAAASAGGFGLLPAEKDALDRFCRTVGKADVGV